MTNQTLITVSSRAGAAFQTSVRTAFVFGGARGPQGFPGDTGPEGPPGVAVNILGEWNTGMTYCPNDGVTAQSSLLQGVTSLYIQRSDVPCSVSTTPPGQDPARWIEIGDTGFGGSTGNIWQVTQVDHGFTRVGTPVFWNAAFDLYQQAQNTPLESLPVAVIREIPDANSLVLQSSGLLPVVDPAIVEGGGGWVDGTVYFQRQNGLVGPNPPVTGFVVPVLLAVGTGGIVFPYQNADAIPPQVPAPIPADTFIKVDDISGLFDNVETSFPLTVAAAPVPVKPSESFQVYIDGNRQEPLADYAITDVAGEAFLTFTTPPEDFQNFWCVYASG